MPKGLDAKQFEKLKIQLEGKQVMSEQTNETNLSGIGTALIDVYKKRGTEAFTQIKESAEQYSKGNMAAAQSPTQIVLGQGSGAINDIIGKVIEPALKPVIEKIAETDIGKSAFEALSKGLEYFEKFKASSPQAKSLGNSIENFVNVASLYPGAKVGQVGVQSVEKGAGATIKAGEAIIDSGKNFTSKVQETLANIDTPTKAVLDPVANAEKAIQNKVSEGILTPKAATQKINQVAQSVKPKSVAVKESADEYLKQAKRAAIDYTQATPLEMAGKKAENALTDLTGKLKKYGEAKQVELTKSGQEQISGLDNVKLRLLENLDKRVGSYIDEDGNIANAPGKVSKIALDPADQKLLKDTYNLINNLGDADSALRIDGTVDALQDLLYKRKANIAQPVNGAVEGVLKEATGELNNLVKSKLGKNYIIANQKFSNIIELRDSLNKALGTDANKGGALMKRVFSPSDGGTKKLFNKIKEVTGIDLTQEAVLAKFAMEAVGDARSANLLEQLGVIQKAVSGDIAGFAKSAAQYFAGKVASKEQVGKRIIQKSIKR